MNDHAAGRTTARRRHRRRLGLMVVIAAVAGAIQQPSAHASTGTGKDPEREAIARAYTALVGRQPSDDEAAFWARRIDGPSGRLELTWLLAKESVPKRIVEGLYVDALGRVAQPAETGYWTSRSPDPVRLALSASIILSSQEATRSRHDEEYVPALYRSVLGRDPDPAGLAYWTGLLNDDAGHMHEVLTLWGTPEARARRIRDAYLRVLGRDPDDAGLAYWVGAGVDEPVISAVLAASDELWRTTTTPDEPFVFTGAVYASTVLGEADPVTGSPASVTYVVVFAVRPAPEQFCTIVTAALTDGGATIDGPCTPSSPFVTGAWRGGTLLLASTNLKAFTVTLTMAR